MILWPFIVILISYGLVYLCMPKSEKKKHNMFMLSLIKRFNKSHETYYKKTIVNILLRKTCEVGSDYISYQDNEVRIDLRTSTTANERKKHDIEIRPLKAEHERHHITIYEGDYGFYKLKRRMKKKLKRERKERDRRNREAEKQYTKEFYEQKVKSMYFWNKKAIRSKKLKRIK